MIDSKCANLLKPFNSINNEYQKMDLHIHSTWTDGKESIEEIVQQAEYLTLSTIAITDHIRETSSYYDEYNKAIDTIRATTNINILAGYETRIKNFNGELDVAEEIERIADIRIASVHRVSFGNKLFSLNIMPKEVAQEIELELSLSAIKNGHFDILGHPGGMCLKYFGEFPIESFEEIIIACKNNNIAFEVNNTYHKDIYPQLKELLKKHNPIVSLGSDAHDKKNIAKWLISGIYKDSKNEQN